MIKKKQQLTLKDVKLPKDPMASDQEDSDVSSLDQTRKHLHDRLMDMPKVNYNLPQNAVPVLGDSFFADQAVNAQVYDLEKKKGSEYSPTGNSWYQSDIDSEYHKFDPTRYPGRKELPENPQESDSVSVDRRDLQSRIINTNTVTSFSDLVNQRFSQAQSKKRVSQVSKRPSFTKRPSRTNLGQQKRSNSKRKTVSRGKLKRDSTILTDQTPITQSELDKLEKQSRQAPQKHYSTKEMQQNKNRLATKIPTIMVNEVTPAGPDQNYHHNLTFTARANTSSKQQSRSMLPDLSKLRTLSPAFNRETELSTPSSGFGRNTPSLERVSLPITPLAGGKDSTIRIQGGAKQLHEMQRTQGQNFSFRNLNASSPKVGGGGAQHQISQKLQTKQSPDKREAESTPERILKEFNEKARAYKFNLASPEAESRPNAAQKWNDLMKECKDEWELTTACLYNPSPMVLYDAYLVNLSHTIAAKLSQIYGRNVRVNLRQGKPFKKIQINVTTVHQSKFCLTKKGNGFGYGTQDKLSPEDAFLQSVFDKVSPDGVAKMRQRQIRKETLAQIVPPIIKKPPRPVKDSLQALHMACRRGIPIDKNGMPFLVEKDPQSREFYRALLKKSGSIMPPQSLRSQSLNTKDSMYQRMLLGDQETSSMAKLSEHSNIKQRSKTNNILSKSPRKQQESAKQSQQWISKVDKLIDKFDESFKQNEEAQKKIIEAQYELKQAKQEILDELEGNKQITVQEEDEDTNNSAANSNEDNSDDDESYKRDSFVAQSDDEQGQRTLGSESVASQLDHKLDEMERTLREQKMMQTFQSNDERKEYHRRLGDMHEKYTHIESEATDALKSQWDTRKELRKMSKPLHSRASLKQSKISFKRNLHKDRIILNDRSGDLASTASRNFLSPQELFTHMENKNIKKEAMLAKMSPYQSAKASKIDLSSQRTFQQNYQYLSQTRALASGNITKGESKIIDVGNLNQTSNPSIKYRPSPIQSPPKSPTQGQQDSKTPTSTRAPRFDINQAEKRDAATARNNKSIMSQLNSSNGNGSGQPYPYAKLPKQTVNSRKQYAKNKDIEVFISTSPQRTPKKFIQTKQQASKKSLINNDQQQNEAYQTMTDLKKKTGPERMPILPELSSREGPRQEMHLTMTEIDSTFTPQNRRGVKNANNEDVGYSSILSVPGFAQESTGGNNPMLTTMFASEDFNTPLAQQSAALNSGTNFIADDAKIVKMQIVDEADEVESINRPSFFDALNQKKVIMKDSPSKFETVTEQKTTSKTTDNVLQFTSPSKQRLRQETSQTAILTASPSSAKKSTIQAIKEQRDRMKKDEVAQTKKAKVPSFSLPPRSKIVTTQGPAQGTTTITSGFKSARGSANQMVNLKPINQTGLTKFRAPYKSCRTSTIDTGLSQIKKRREPAATTRMSPAAATSATVSPFQMMLEEMKQENRTGQGLARPTVGEMDEFNDMQGGAETLEENPGGHYLAYEEKLELMMKTNSSVFGVGLPDDAKNQTILSQLTKVQNQTMNFTKGKLLGGNDDRKDKYKKPYFKNQPPLNETFTKVLQRKYRETDANFREEARKLIDGVRKLEQTSRNDGVQFAQTTQGAISQFQQTTSAFKGRTESLGHHISAKNKSIKDQLCELKLAEINPTSNHTAKSISRRRKTEFVVGAMNKTGFETVRNDQNLLHGSEEPQGLDWQFVSSLHDESSAYGRQNQVQYSFRKFRLDSQREHTRNILPSMTKLL